MPRQESLSAVQPNRFYEINATLKYQHVGENNITGVIQQGDFQSKICIPKSDVNLIEGQSYTFGKCFNSRNGWLYARNPTETVQPQPYATSEIVLTLKEINANKDALLNHYITTEMRVIEIEPKQTIKKNGEELILYKMKCFADSLIVEISIWNKEIKQSDILNKVVKLIGFRIKPLTHQTFTLVSTVYSKIETVESISQIDRFDYKFNYLYKNVSNVYEIRKIEDIYKACETNHKNYTITEGVIADYEELQYEGCSICKRKIFENGCYQCGSAVTKTVYTYLRVAVEDSSSMIECAVFNETVQELTKRAKGNGKAILRIKSSAKRNHDTGEFYTSHVLTEIKEFVDQKQ